MTMQTGASEGCHPQTEHRCDHWASCTAHSSCAITGIKRSAIQATIAKSSTGTFSTRSGRKNDCRASVSCEDVVVNTTSKLANTSKIMRIP